MTASSGAPWAVGPAEVLGSLGADAMTGLTSEEATGRLALTGPNEIEEEPRRPSWLRFVAQFANTLSAVLVAAAAITLLIGDVKDTTVIGVVLVLNGVVGYIQEGRAERAVEALRRMAADRCRVRRDGVAKEVATAVLVPGDIVMLESGEIVPADLRLLDVQALWTQEAALTGEAEAVAKSVDLLEPPAGALLADRRCMVFKGTSVSHGRATGVVTATGNATEIGRMAQLVQSHPRSLTPLQVRLAALGRSMAAGQGLGKVSLWMTDQDRRARTGVPHLPSATRSAMSSQALLVRPIRAGERARFDETLAAEDWLGGGLVGEVMRYVAEEDGEWCALLAFN